MTLARVPEVQGPRIPLAARRERDFQTVRAPRALPAAQAQAPLKPGAQIGTDYRVLDHLNRSNSQDVYEVWSASRTSRCVAKLLRPDRRAETDARDRLRQEAYLLLDMSHPHVVRAYELLEGPLGPVLILETLTDATLYGLLEAQSSRLPWRDVAYLGLHIASALSYLHQRGYVHLDVKPGNIMCSGGLAKLIDLSLAVRLGGSSSAGTQYYKAPEQVAHRSAWPAIDVWGLGAVLYEAAAGKAAFSEASGPGKYPQAAVRAPSIRRLRRLPSPFACLIDACLEMEPSARPRIEEVHATLAGLTGEPPAETGSGARFLGQVQI
jgi:serine/threonine protein kinase